MASEKACGECGAANPVGCSFCWACHSPKAEKLGPPTAAAAKIGKAREKARVAARRAAKGKRASK